MTQIERITAMEQALNEITFVMNDGVVIVF